MGEGDGKMRDGVYRPDGWPQANDQAGTLRCRITEMQA